MASGNAAGSPTNGHYSEEDFLELKRRCHEHCQNITDGDQSQIFSDGSLQRFLRAWQTPDAAFTAVTKCHKWREEYGVEELTDQDPDIQEELKTGKATVLSHRDTSGRPVVYIAARKHNAYERDIDRLTKFIVYNLELACRKCHEDVADNLCIVFDLKDFALANMDYQFVKNLIWLLSKHYPERLGVCLIINSPIIFWGCWAIIRPWLNEVTASKVTFVSEAQLSDYLHPSILPKD